MDMHNECGQVSGAENLESQGACASNSDREVAGICRDLSKGNSTRRARGLLQASFPVHLETWKHGGSLQTGRAGRRGAMPAERRCTKCWTRGVRAEFQSPCGSFPGA